ncbi:uncharacterized protein LACBIDRAFT_332494 [Laccaria bicolor S238N-H82]|uniref:Predicted protein n=1 Tax=Laccaria bicolor (strain S238N-H82 / ATCC MYA-4686) TaxID=486041 RepID=B0DSX0_LACBS|nr:uncharacterized protein LACBIDRAFT_332494 [Laccaria bicolor S238N-H82]EDR02387.1 predicted protein [Laccaria bicolor S238N-H82]|eukprot:XP_001887064.1 predicted protein [Laccaria bicolor S238N-H82]
MTPEYVNILLNACQQHKRQIKFTEEHSGPEHDKTFTVIVFSKTPLEYLVTFNAEIIYMGNWKSALACITSLVPEVDSSPGISPSVGWGRIRMNVHGRIKHWRNVCHELPLRGMKRRKCRRETLASSRDFLRNPGFYGRTPVGSRWGSNKFYELLRSGTVAEARNTARAVANECMSSEGGDIVADVVVVKIKSFIRKRMSPTGKHPSRRSLARSIRPPIPSTKVKHVPRQPFSLRHYHNAQLN